MTWIITATGNKFDFLNPTVEMIHPVDIATALSVMPRFNGHAHLGLHFNPYTVGAHSLFVASMVPPDLRDQALLHDASEAYIGDIVTPLKHIIGEGIREIEDRIFEVIAKKFNISAHLDPAVKYADKVALATEREFLMPFHPEPWECLEGVFPVSRQELWPYEQMGNQTVKRLILEALRG